MKIRYKGIIFPIVSGLVVGMFLVSVLSLRQSISSSIPEDFSYVSSTIIDNSLPVLSYDSVLIRPYQTDRITVEKRFYDEDNKELGIIYFNNTYMQSSGILYSSEEEYNIVSILDGEVIDIKKDDILGNTVEVKHTDNLISSYQGLQNVYVKKGDHINQNTIIGKSGTIKLDKDYNNALLFELIKDGHYINPDKYFDKTVREI